MSCGRRQGIRSSVLLFDMGLHRLDDAHPRWLEQSSLLSPLIQMMISSLNALTDKSKDNVLPSIWASLSPVK